MTSKLVTIKLIITVFLFCPFITYGMKRKRAEIENLSSTIVKPTKNQSPRIAITEKQKNLTTEIIQKILQKNNQYICIHSNCDNNYNYQDKTYLSDHIIGIHIKPYWCSLCHQTLSGSWLAQANRTMCSVSSDYEHSVIIKELTFEQEEELRKDFGLEHSIPTPSLTPSNNAAPNRSKQYIRIFSEKQNKDIRNIIEKCYNNNEYKCPSCPDKFAINMKSSFKNHLLSHHIHPFSCSTCNQELKVSDRTIAMRTKCTGNSGHHIPINNINIKKNLTQLRKAAKLFKETSKIEQPTHQNKRPRRREFPFDQSIPQDSSTTAMEISQQNTDKDQGNSVVTNNHNQSSEEPNTKSINWEEELSSLIKEDADVDANDDFFNLTHYDDNLLDF